MKNNNGYEDRIAEDPIVRFRKVSAESGLGHSAIYTGMAEGTFPRQIKLTPSGRAVGWLWSEIQAWKKARIAATKAERTPREATAAAERTPPKPGGES